MTGIEPMTFRVLGGCDSHYTTSAYDFKNLRNFYNDRRRHPVSIEEEKEIIWSNRVPFQVHGKGC